MIIEPAITLIDLPATSKKQVLEDIAREICYHFGQPSGCLQLFDKLMERERIGSTGIGAGVAIPHIRLDNIDTPMGVLVRLKTAVSFDAADGQPVDLIYVLIAPEKSAGASLLQLARISSFFRDQEFCDILRAEQEDICGLLCFRNAQMDQAA